MRSSSSPFTDAQPPSSDGQPFNLWKSPTRDRAPSMGKKSSFYGLITSLLSKQQDSDRIDLENRTLGIHIFEMSRWTLWVHGVTLKSLSTNCSPNLMPDILPLGIHSTDLSLKDFFTFPHHPTTPQAGLLFAVKHLSDRE